MDKAELLKQICEKNKIDIKVINNIIEAEKKEVYKRYRRNIKGTLRSIIESNIEEFKANGGINIDNK